MIVTPDETVNLIKRFMGGTYEEVQDAIKHIQYKVVNDNGLPRIVINGRKYSPEELSAMILTKMKKTAEDYLGEEVTDAVITVPAFFSDAAKSATKQAGELAGLNVLRIISEPTAALLASNIDKVKGGKYIVVDFGGSTTDFSVADISDNVVEILSSFGDVYLGGSDIDKLVADYVVEEYKKKTGINLNENTKDGQMAMSRVYEAVEKAKIELSNASATEINLPYIVVMDGKPQHLEMTITRAKFEQIISPIVNRVINCGIEALKKAKMDKNDLDGILLVGGSCRIPKVQEELIKNFGDKLIKSANLDLAVAEGAAIQADILSGNTKNEILLLDVCPLGLGIETLGGIMTTIIESNKTIPCSCEQEFTTAKDNQSSVTINVLQGERIKAKDNKQIGLFNLDGIAPAKRGVPKIKVKFDIDANGILSVSATDNATGKEQHITIENRNTLSQEEIDRIKREAEEFAEEDAKVKERLKKQNEIDSLVYQIENFMDEYKDKPSILTEEDKTYFDEKIKELNKTREGDLTNADALISEVSARLATVGSKAYTNNQQSDANPFNFGQQGFNDIFNGYSANQSNKNEKEDVEEV